MSLRAQIVLASMLVLATSAALEAQPMASERASVAQTVDGTTVTIDYARPRIRGRGEPFGGIVSIGDHRWTPGANWATTITANKAFTLNDHPVPEGTWSMWIDLEEDAWTLVLDPEDSLYHTFPPEDSEEQIRFELRPREGPFVETMLFWVPEVRLSGFDLLLSWGTTEVPFEVGVEPTFSAIVAEEQGRELDGAYLLEYVSSDDASGSSSDHEAESHADGDEPGSASDDASEPASSEPSASHTDGDEPASDADEPASDADEPASDADEPGPASDADEPERHAFDVRWEDDHVTVSTSWGGPEVFDAWLIPRGADYYHMAWVEDGEIWEVLSAMGTIEVVRDEDGGVIGFDFRGQDDSLWAIARRVPRPADQG